MAAGGEKNVMIENFRISFRHLWHNKLFSLINILGLSLGLSSCFILLLHVRFETGFDRFHQKRDRIVRVLHENYSFTPMVMSGVLPAYFPEIEKVVRVAKYGWTRFYVKQEGAFVEETNLVVADSTFFDVFSFPLVSGNVDKVLRSPDRLLLSETMAMKYFGKLNPVGKTITFRLMNKDQLFTVEGVFRDFPEQSHFHASFLASMKLFPSQMNGNMSTNWGSNSVGTYLLMKEAGQMQSISDRMPGFIKANVPGDYAKDLHYSLQPLVKIHLYSTNLDIDIEAQGSITRVVIFTSIAMLVLVIAVVNFVLLSLALSYQRIKEFGIRNIMGASRRELVSLVSSEFLIIFVLASQIALMMVELAVPYLESHMGFRIGGGIFTHGILLLLFLAVAFLLGYFASIFITLQTMRVNPVDALKSRLFIRNGRMNSSSVLVVFQFCIMIILLVSLIVMHKQIWLIRHMDLGYRKDQLVTVDIPVDAGKKYQLLRDELRKLSGIRNVSGANYIPPTGQWWITYMKNPETGEKIELEEIEGDFGLAETMGLEIVQGRDISPEFGNDSLAMLINESGLRSSGISNPFESYLVLGDKDTTISRRHIVGVFKDFHMRSLYDEIRPMAIFMNTGIIQQMAVRIDSKDTKAVMNEVIKTWQKFFPDDPIQYSFVDEALRQNYLNEDQSQAVIGLFTVLSLFIALLGLFGLSSYSLERRTKETGVRRVNGAGVMDMFYVFSRQFALWILISFVLAIPVSYIAMTRWLQHFAYRTGISWWVYALALLASILVAGITIGWQTYRAATRNPVEALRYE